MLQTHLLSLLCLHTTVKGMMTSHLLSTPRPCPGDCIPLPGTVSLPWGITSHSLAPLFPRVLHTLSSLPSSPPVHVAWIRRAGWNHRLCFPVVLRSSRALSDLHSYTPLTERTCHTCSRVTEVCALQTGLLFTMSLAGGTLHTFWSC